MFEEKKKPAALGGEAAGALSLSRVRRTRSKYAGAWGNVIW